MEYTKIQLRRDTQANWSRYNPILAEGEMGIVTDVNKFKIGDGFTSFLLLPFATKSVDELDKEFQGLQAQINVIEGANYQTAEQVENAITTKDYATNTRVNEVEGKILADGATKSELQAVEDKIPTDNKQLANGADYATNTKVNEVETLANTKTTIGEVEGKGYQTSEQVNSAIIAKDYATNTRVNEIDNKIPTNVVSNEQLQAVEDKIPTNNNQLTNGANYTTMSEVEGKGYQTSAEVESAITTKGYQTAEQVEGTITGKGYTTIGEVEGKGYQTAEQVEQAVTAKNYVAKDGFATINNQSITDGGNIEIQGGGGADIEVDTRLDLTTNPVENQAITNEVLDLKNNVNKINANIDNNLTFNDEVWSFTMEDGSVINKNISIKEVNYFYVEDASGTSDNQVWIEKFADYSDIKVEYSTDTKVWNAWNDPTTEKVTIPQNGKVYIRGKNQLFKKNRIKTSNLCNVGGDLTCLLEPNGNVLDLTDRGYCFSNLFGLNFNLVSAENLNLTSKITYFYCYDSLFDNCSSLVKPPKLVATTLGVRCYNHLFSNCSSLQVAPELPNKKLNVGCYQHMFSNCSNLTTAPALPAMELTDSCYRGMFTRCDKLINPPTLPATELVENCYEEIFSYCSSLEEAPIILGKNLSEYGIWQMFQKCSKINKIEIDITNWDILKAQYWVQGVAPQGVFIKPKALQVGDGVGQIPIANEANNWSGIPDGWTIIDK